MANIKGGSKPQNITFCFNVSYFVSKTKRGKNFRHPTVMRILEVLCVCIGWGKSPDNALECSREASEGVSVLLLTGTVWDEDGMIRVL